MIARTWGAAIESAVPAITPERSHGRSTSTKCIMRADLVAGEGHVSPDLADCESGLHVGVNIKSCDIYGYSVVFLLDHALGADSAFV